MNIALFILLNLFSVFAVFYIVKQVVSEYKNKKYAKPFIIVLITIGLIGNFFVSKYLLNLHL